MIKEKICVPNRAQERLSTLIFRPPSRPGFVLLVAHGFRGAKENRGRIESLAAKVVELGGSLWAFDFRGSGESDGSFRDVTLTRQMEDLRLMVDYVKRVEPGPLAVLGRSFGGTTALGVAALVEGIEWLILWSAPVYVAKTFQDLMPKEWELLFKGQEVTLRDEGGEYILGPDLVRDLVKHDVLKYLQMVKSKRILVVHGENDEVVPPANALAVRDNAPCPVELHLIPGADHRFTEHQVLREEITCRWLKRNLCRDAFLA